MKETLKDTLKDYHTEQVIIINGVGIYKGISTSKNPFGIY